MNTFEWQIYIFVACAMQNLFRPRPIPPFRVFCLFSFLPSFRPSFLPSFLPSCIFHAFIRSIHSLMDSWKCQEPSKAMNLDSRITKLFSFESKNDYIFPNTFLWRWGTEMISFPLIKSRKAWMWISYLSNSWNVFGNMYQISFENIKHFLNREASTKKPFLFSRKGIIKY